MKRRIRFLCWLSCLVSCSLASLQSLHAQGSLADYIELLQPGLAVRSMCPIPGQCLASNDPSVRLFTAIPAGMAGTSDVLGKTYFTDQDGNLDCAPLPGRTYVARLFRVREDGTAELVARLTGTCDDSPPGKEVSFGGVVVDQVNGKLLVTADGSGIGSDFLVITGLPSLLDIVPTFDPNNTLSVSWVTPLKPEAMAGSEKFSVYAGPLIGPTSLSQATPLDCSVPDAGPPSPGEYFSVPDTLGPLSAGAGRFYLVANHFREQVRVGRETMAQVIRGRNATVLPVCH